MSRYVWLIRHAKSDWSNGAQRDFDRPLNDRGRRDGPRMQAWLEAQQPAATWIWCSPAKRALQTCTFVANAFGTPEAQIVEVPELYLASAETALDSIRATPAAEPCVALIFHNPGISQLVWQLLGTFENVPEMPTFGAACLRTELEWSDARPGAFELAHFSAPKRLPEKKQLPE